MKKLISENYQSFDYRREVIAKSAVTNQNSKTERIFVKEPSIDNVRKAIIRAVPQAIKETADEAYDYRAFSWRGTGAEEERRLDIYEDDEHGHVTACLWQEYYDENNILSGEPVFVFSVSNVMISIEVMNKWMHGETDTKIQNYIIANRISFSEVDFHNGIYIIKYDFRSFHC